MQEYRYKPGSRFAAPAQAVGERLEAITARSGSITPQAVVDDARDPASPLNGLIEWDDSIASEKFRLEQARRILRSVYPVHLDAAGHPTPVLGWIHVDVPDEGPVYVTSLRAVLEPQLRAQVIQEAEAAYQALRRRYAHIEELGEVFRAVDRALRRVARAKGAAKERPGGAAGAKVAVGGRR